MLQNSDEPAVKSHCPEVYDHDKDEWFVCPNWMGVVANIKTLERDGTYNWASSSKLRDDFKSKAMAGGFDIGHGSRGAVKEYPGNFTWYVKFICIIAALGGLIFGYDLGISGGVTSMDPFLLLFFPSDYHKKKLDTSTNQYFGTTVCIRDGTIQAPWFSEHGLPNSNHNRNFRSQFG
ncbi:hypothetical protein Ddye_024885 [Dipteronia dyeriana]|uniref:Uncharacterized protein n=1 Tax=Dipteronia dyeriana TaxID=168575 RepID=A0AAD9TW64_9ROSI|nr:hypothetical protein Ddye_024885 [Dipteronia dyeriana]